VVPFRTLRGDFEVEGLYSVLGDFIILSLVYLRGLQHSMSQTVNFK